MKTEKPEPKFKEGDVVILRSGGDYMTVEVVLPYARTVHPGIGYICVWMYEGTIKRNEISESALVWTRCPDNHVVDRNQGGK